MKPIEFKEHNVVIAKDQPPYLPLPALVIEDQTISCWKLTWKERLQILLGKPLWLTQLNFKMPLQPQRPSIEQPFEVTY